MLGITSHHSKKLCFLSFLILGMSELTCLWFMQCARYMVFLSSGRINRNPCRDQEEIVSPLVFFGTTGTMLDIIMGISQCESEHAECQMKLLEEQNLVKDASAEIEN